MNYMKGVLDWAATHPDKAVLFDTETEKDMSYSWRAGELPVKILS